MLIASPKSSGLLGNSNPPRTRRKRGDASRELGGHVRPLTEHRGDHEDDHGHEIARLSPRRFRGENPGVRRSPAPVSERPP